jgi:hypothetical protein
MLIKKVSYLNIVMVNVSGGECGRWGHQPILSDVTSKHSILGPNNWSMPIKLISLCYIALPQQSRSKDEDVDHVLVLKSVFKDNV